jgi:SAM-dependent methyltransferase
MNPDWPEITDLIINYDPISLERQDVHKIDVIERFRDVKDHWAVKIVESFPDKNGILDADWIDRMMIRIHNEIQILSEEFYHGLRIFELLGPLINTLKDAGVQGPYRVVDIGCGIGFVIRWLAKHGHFGDDVQLIGADYNRAFVAEATRLAQVENLNCKFIVANAFKLDKGAHIFCSTGVLHHFRGGALESLFSEHEHELTQAFFHYDFQPSIFAPIGAWLFHFARVRFPVSHHDGRLSAIRAHSGETLVNAARSSLPHFRCALYSKNIRPFPLPRVFHTILGIRPKHQEAFIEQLGSRRSRLEELK